MPSPDPNYPSVGDEESVSDEDNPADNEDKENSERPDSETTLVPKSMLKDGVEPGDKCTFEVVSVHDGEVELKWTADDKEESDKSDKSISESMGGSPMPSRRGGGY